MMMMDTSFLSEQNNGPGQFNNLWKNLRSMTCRQRIIFVGAADAAIQDKKQEGKDLSTDEV